MVMEEGVKQLTDEDLQYYDMDNLKHRIHQAIFDFQSDKKLTAKDLHHTINSTNYIITIERS